MENVNHPEHYQGTNMECIDSMLLSFGPDAMITFCLMNAYKYIWRSDKKNGEEDIAKAKRYLRQAELTHIDYDSWPIYFDYDFIKIMRNQIESMEVKEICQQATSVIKEIDPDNSTKSIKIQ